MTRRVCVCLSVFLKLCRPVGIGFQAVPLAWAFRCSLGKLTLQCLCPAGVALVVGGPSSAGGESVSPPPGPSESGRVALGVGGAAERVLLGTPGSLIDMLQLRAGPAVGKGGLLVTQWHLSSGPHARSAHQTYEVGALIGVMWQNGFLSYKGLGTRVLNKVNNVSFCRTSRSLSLCSFAPGISERVVRTPHVPGLTVDGEMCTGCCQVLALLRPRAGRLEKSGLGSTSPETRKWGLARRSCLEWIGFCGACALISLLSEVVCGQK